MMGRLRVTGCGLRDGEVLSLIVEAVLEEEKVRKRDEELEEGGCGEEISTL